MGPTPEAMQDYYRPVPGVGKATETETEEAKSMENPGAAGDVGISAKDKHV